VGHPLCVERRTRCGGTLHRRSRKAGVGRGGWERGRVNTILGRKGGGRGAGSTVSATRRLCGCCSRGSNVGAAGVGKRDRWCVRECICGLRHIVSGFATCKTDKAGWVEGVAVRGGLEVSLGRTFWRPGGSTADPTLASVQLSEI
jgi:hypothetical protein